MASVKAWGACVENYIPRGWRWPWQSFLSAQNLLYTCAPPSHVPLKSRLFIFVSLFSVFLLQYLSNLCSIFFGIVLCFLVGSYSYKLKGFILGLLPGWVEISGSCLDLSISFDIRALNFNLAGRRSLIVISVIRRRRDKNDECIALSFLPYTIEWVWVHWLIGQGSEVAV